MNNQDLQDIRATIAKMQTELSSCESRLEAGLKDITSLQLKTANMFSNTVDVKPSTATKVVFNRYGQIVNTEPLSQSDIPEINIAKVNGLQGRLDRYATQDDIKQILDLINRKTATGDAIKTGTKVSVDDNGRVVNLGSLTADDIPKLPVDKINGLKDSLDYLNRVINSRPATPYTPGSPYTIQPGTGTKITYNSSGMVVRSTNLSVADIPTSLLDDITELHNQLAKAATKADILTIANALAEKVDKVKTIPGRYTKVTVNKYGQVIDGDYITKDDLPRFNVSDIAGLNEALNNTAKKEDINSLRSKIGTVEYDNGIIKSQINVLNRDLNNLIDVVQKLSNTVAELQQRIINPTPSHEEVLLAEIANLKSANATLSARINTLEQKVVRE
jgi:hypothetical protein